MSSQAFRWLARALVLALFTGFLVLVGLVASGPAEIALIPGVASFTVPGYALAFLGVLFGIGLSVMLALLDPGPRETGDSAPPETGQADPRPEPRPDPAVGPVLGLVAATLIGLAVAAVLQGILDPAQAALLLTLTVGAAVLTGALFARLSRGDRVDIESHWGGLGGGLGGSLGGWRVSPTMLLGALLALLIAAMLVTGLWRRAPDAPTPATPPAQERKPGAAMALPAATPSEAAAPAKPPIR
jgi:hypothetical protein